jgi:hypothetical protein
MGKFVVQNLSGRSVRLAIEPWADLEIVEPKGRVLFEHEDDEEPAEISFAVTDDGICVGIMSDLVKVIGSSGEKTFRNPWAKKPEGAK